MLFLFIPRTPISAIFKTIMCQAVMADIDQIAIMATLACLYLSIHRADIGVYAKNRKNADQL